MMDEVNVRLTPFRWRMALSNQSRLHAPGRSLSVDCRMVDSDLVLSSDEHIGDMPIQITLSTGEPIIGNNERLERGIGLFHYSPAKEWKDGESRDAYISGWFCVDQKIYDEVWSRIGGKPYSECKIDIDIAPVPVKGVRFFWDVQQSPRLFITGAAFQFVYDEPRPLPAPLSADQEPTQPKKWWRCLFS